MPSPALSPVNPPAVLSAAQRHDLAVQFERAKQLAMRTPPDFAAAHRLLSECCTLDPGNTHFLAVLLKNLRLAKGALTRAWPWQVWQRRRKLAAARQAGELGVALAHAWFLLGENPRNYHLLMEVAEIEKELDHFPASVLLLQEADRIAPGEADVLRPLAIAYGENGALEQAAGAWHALLELLPQDAQAAAMVQLLKRLEPSPIVPGRSAMEQVEQYIAQKQWQAAAALLDTQLKSAGTDMKLESLSGEIAIGQAREKTDLARQLHEAMRSARSQEVVDSLLIEQRRIELGVAYARYERFPSEPESSWELAACLTRSGNFSEAIKYLATLTKDEKWRMRALIASGENWQQLRQFERALSAYREALDHPDLDPHDEHVQKGWHRAAVLAEAAGNPADALTWLEQLMAANPGYKDARARLDNLRAICNKGGFSARPQGSD